MKSTKLFSTAVVSLLAVTLFSCSKPKQREETIDKEIQPNIVQVSDLHDITSDTTKAYFYKESANTEVTAADKSSQIKIDDNIKKVLSLVKIEETKKSLEDQLSKSGLIAFAIMTDSLKIYKVLQKDKVGADVNANTALTLLQIKQAKKASLESKMIATTNLDMTESKNDIVFIEVVSLNLSKSGVLENKKTKYYDEKTSILTVADRPLDLSTHLVLEPQKTAEEVKAAAEKAAKK